MPNFSFSPDTFDLARTVFNGTGWTKFCRSLGGLTHTDDQIDRVMRCAASQGVAAQMVGTSEKLVKIDLYQVYWSLIDLLPRHDHTVALAMHIRLDIDEFLRGGGSTLVGGHQFLSIDGQPCVVRDDEPSPDVLLKDYASQIVSLSAEVLRLKSVQDDYRTALEAATEEIKGLKKYKLDIWKVPD